jgi:hypothetical protein
MLLRHATESRPPGLNAKAAGFDEAVRSPGSPQSLPAPASSPDGTRVTQVSTGFLL